MPTLHRASKACKPVQDSGPRGYWHPHFPWPDDPPIVESGKTVKEVLDGLLRKCLLDVASALVSARKTHADRRLCSRLERTIERLNEVLRLKKEARL